MKKHFIIFFVIVISGLILCSYLNQSNYYNCIEGFDFTKTYKANDNTIAIISQNRNSSYTITITNSDETTTTYTTSVGDPTRKFYNPDTSYAVVSADENQITVTGANKSTKIYYNRTTSTDSSGTSSSNDYDNYNHYDGTSNASIYYSSNGNGYTARILDTGTNKMIIITRTDGSTLIFYYSGYPDLYNGENDSFIKLIRASDGTKTIELTTSTGKKVYYVKTNNLTTNNSDTDNFESTSSYNSSLPQGIKWSQIPAGEKNMYILKSQIVPPVCPSCPSYSLSCPSTSSSKGSSGSSSSSKGSNNNSNSSNNSKGSSNSSNSSNSKNPATTISNKDYSSTTYNPNDLNEINKTGNGNITGTNYKKPSMTIPIPVLSDFSTFGM